MISKKLTEQQNINKNQFTVIGCNFIDCIASQNKRGGAIHYSLTESMNGIVTVYSSSFEKCKVENGDGGAIFVCKVEKSTGFDSTHDNINFFNSSYCCYSQCSATGSGEVSGYGPVMFIFANEIEILFSTSVKCPVDGKSYAAQFDLKSYTIKSSYINSTKGTADYCCAMEYRMANQGYFRYQTFVDLTGCYLTSFTNIDKKLDISYCNYVNDTIRHIDNQKGAFIYVRKCDVYISNFCFVGINVDDNFDFVFFDGETKTITLDDSFIENSMKNHLNDVTTNNVTLYADNTEKYTNLIDLLGLGPCQGNVAPPPTIFSSTFTPTSVFSNSFDFTESKMFSETDKFSSSQKFSESAKLFDSYFSQSSMSPQQTSRFSKSKVFSESDSFEQTIIFIDRDVDLQGNGNDKKLPVGAIVGIAIAAAAVVGVIIAVIFIIRAKRASIISEGIDMNDMETQSIKTANPLYGEGGDDPFKEDFDNN